MNIKFYMSTNGTDPDTPNGKPSLDEPTFTGPRTKSSRKQWGWIYMEISIHY